MMLAPPLTSLYLASFSRQPNITQGWGRPPWAGLSCIKTENKANPPPTHSQIKLIKVVPQWKLSLREFGAVSS